MKKSINNKKGTYKRQNQRNDKSNDSLKEGYRYNKYIKRSQRSKIVKRDIR